MSETLTLSDISGRGEYIRAHFWQMWQLERESLYRCCQKLMGNNPTLAEDALSQAMLKAWEKVQAGACRMANFKAWVRTLTRNLCIDILRSQGSSANRTESLDALPCLVDEVLVSPDEEFSTAAERRERAQILAGAIDALPPLLREPVRLHYYQQKSYLEITEELGIKYPNVRKRLSDARAILREKLSEFVGEEDGLRPEPRNRGKSKKRSLRAPAVGESLASPSGDLEWVLPAESGEPVGASLSVLPGEPAFEAACFEGELGIVAGSEPLAGLSAAPASFEALEEEPLGISAGGLKREAGSLVVPVAPALGEACSDGELGIVAGGQPLLGGLGTGRIIKIVCRIFAAPLSDLKAGCGTGGRQFQPPSGYGDRGEAIPAPGYGVNRCPLFVPVWETSQTASAIVLYIEANQTKTPGGMLGKCIQFGQVFKVGRDAGRVECPGVMSPPALLIEESGGSVPLAEPGNAGAPDCPEPQVAAPCLWGVMSGLKSLQSSALKGWRSRGFGGPSEKKFHSNSSQISDAIVKYIDAHETKMPVACWATLFSLDSCSKCVGMPAGLSLKESDSRAKLK